jgi:hypothetical protein
LDRLELPFFLFETFFRIATGQQLDDLAPAAVYKAAKESFTPEVIVASWKRTGMWPADFDLIRSRADSTRRNCRVIARQRRHYPGSESHQGNLSFALSIRSNEGWQDSPAQQIIFGGNFA